MSSSELVLWTVHHAHKPPNTRAVKLANHMTNSRRLVFVGGGAKHVGHPLPGCRKWPFDSSGHTFFLPLPEAVVALHVLLNQELSRVPVHGTESLCGALSGPPSTGAPRILEFENFVPQGVDAFSRQAGRQNHLSRGVGGWHRQEVQGLGVRGGGELA